MLLAGFKLTSFEYWMERNPCLQSKWHAFNSIIVMGLAKPPN